MDLDQLHMPVNSAVRLRNPSRSLDGYGNQTRVVIGIRG